MNFGMVGALGGMGGGTGVGGALMAQGDFLRKQEELDLDEGRKRALATFNANLAQEMAQRADQYAWSKKVERAPQEASMAAQAETVKSEAALKFKTNNQDALSAVTRSDAVAKETPSVTAKNQAEARDKDADVNYKNAYADFLKGGKGQGLKLSDADKEALKTADEEVHDAQKGLNTALGTLMPGDDGSKNPGVTMARQRLSQAKSNQLRTQIQRGVVTPDHMAQTIAGAATSGKDAMESLNQLRSVAGSDFTDKVAGLLQNMDSFKQMDDVDKRAERAANPQTPAGKASKAAGPGSVVLTPGATPGMTGAPPAPAPAAPPPAANPTGLTAQPRVNPMPMQPPVGFAPAGLSEQMQAAGIDAETDSQLQQDPLARQAEVDKRAAWMKGEDTKPFDDKVASLRAKIRAQVVAKRAAAQQTAGR